MTVRNFVPVLLLFLGGCATYKQLKPVPLPQSAEKGYIELKRKEKNFKLKRVLEAESLIDLFFWFLKFRIKTWWNNISPPSSKIKNGREKKSKTRPMRRTA